MATFEVGPEVGVEVGAEVGVEVGAEVGVEVADTKRVLRGFNVCYVKFKLVFLYGVLFLWGLLDVGP